MRRTLLAVVLLSLGACTSSPPSTGSADVIEVGMPWGDVAAVLHKHQFVLSTQCLSNDRLLFGWPPNYCADLRGDRLLIINADEDATVVESIAIAASVSQPKAYRGEYRILKRFDPAADPYERHRRDSDDFLNRSDGAKDEPATASPRDK